MSTKNVPTYVATSKVIYIFWNICNVKSYVRYLANVIPFRIFIQHYSNTNIPNWCFLPFLISSKGLSPVISFSLWIHLDSASSTPRDKKSPWHWIISQDVDDIDSLTIIICFGITKSSISDNNYKSPNGVCSMYYYLHSSKRN